MEYIYFLIGHEACSTYLNQGMEALLKTDYEIVAYPEDQLKYLGYDTQGKTILKIPDTVYELLEAAQFRPEKDFIQNITL